MVLFFWRMFGDRIIVSVALSVNGLLLSSSLTGVSRLESITND